MHTEMTSRSEAGVRGFRENNTCLFGPFLLRGIATFLSVQSVRPSLPPPTTPHPHHIHSRSPLHPRLSPLTANHTPPSGAAFVSDQSESPNGATSTASHASAYRPVRPDCLAKTKLRSFSPFGHPRSLPSGRGRSDSQLRHPRAGKKKKDRTQRI